ncbi:MAG: hypothetical protein O2931_17275, partial [Planctomycetota bacterium]|nr:hypothetical protein [Planctomycetota bacterium]
TRTHSYRFEHLRFAVRRLSRSPGYQIRALVSGACRHGIDSDGMLNSGKLLRVAVKRPFMRFLFFRRSHQRRGIRVVALWL